MPPKSIFRPLLLLFLILVSTVFIEPLEGQAAEEIQLPLNMSVLRNELSLVRAGTDRAPSWPRKIIYDQAVFDAERRAFRYTVHTFIIPEKPERIVPRTVNIAEILWAICPRERIAALHRKTADPSFSFIADQIGGRFPLFSPGRIEEIISARPDLVLTAYPSGTEFKQAIDNAEIPCLDLGYIGSIRSIQKQIRLIGRAIGETGNAEALIQDMNHHLRQLIHRIPKPDPPPRMVFYSEDGYVSGRSTGFDAICRIIGAVNVAAEQKIAFIKKVDPDVLLEWNPDCIVIPSEWAPKLYAHFLESPIISRTEAVRNGRVYAVDARYLNAGSQFILMGANLLAGILHAGAF